MRETTAYEGSVINCLDSAMQKKVFKGKMEVHLK